MSEWAIAVSDDLVEQLAESMQQGPIWEIIDGTGQRLLTEDTIARINGLKVQVFANEHPPPHFRVEYQSSTANYKILDCARLNGSGEVLRYEKNVRLWWEDNKDKLISTWNRLRPSDCPVGEYKE